MRRKAFLAAVVAAVPVLAVLAQQQGPERVDEQLLTTYQRLQPAGKTLVFNGRPVAMALSQDGQSLWVKDNTGLRLVDTKTWVVKASAGSQGGASPNGLFEREGKVYFTSAENELHTFALKDGKIEKLQTVKLPGPKGVGESFPCGLALDGGTAYVCLSRNNTLGVVDLAQGKLTKEIPVGVAPYEVALLPGGLAAVSNQGGRRPVAGAKTAKSAGTETEVDERGVASTGTVSIVDLKSGRTVREVAVGLQPCGLAVGQGWFAVANANSDTVSLVSTTTWKVESELVVKTTRGQLFGSMPNALALGGDGKTMFVALAGNNAVAIVDTSVARTPVVRGFVPTGWYPGAVIARGGAVYVANIKGVGSRTQRREPGKGWNSHDHAGTVQRFAYPDPAQLAEYTAQVRDLGKVPSLLSMLERKGSSATKPVPVPKNLGDPSTIEHVIYVIKENRSYDQVLGDMAKGSGEPALCVFGEKVTPNQHALADQFVLLDNYYCEGVLSADGHSWATEGNVTPYLERAFGGFNRSYTFGNDPITYSSSGFVWDRILAGGLSFRNFGEMDDAGLPAGWKMEQVWRDYAEGEGAVFKQDMQIEKLRRYSCRDYPGWNTGIPDSLRAHRFLRELKQMELDGSMPDFMIVYLPQDHTAGTTPGYPTVASYVADNDRALGRIVDAVSHSQFWPTTAIFVNEDDPQAGFDHVDGHRSLCLVVSPWTRGGKVDSHFYNQNSVLHTVLRIFGMPPLNEQNARSPLMFDCFGPVADVTPYDARDPQVDIGALNPPLSELRGDALRFARLSLRQNFDEPDAADEDSLNRIVWFAMKGSAPYPADWAGAHGRGLAARGLKSGG